MDRYIDDIHRKLLPDGKNIMVHTEFNKEYGCVIQWIRLSNGTPVWLTQQAVEVVSAYPGD